MLLIPSPTGVAERVTVGCVYTGPSTAAEIATFISGHTHHLMEGTDPFVNSSNCPYQYEDTIDYPSVEFDAVNPHNATYRTVVIRNSG